MDVSIRRARATLRAREARARAAGEARERRIMARLPGIVDALRREGATRIVLFGSLAEGRASADSDLDLAVAGIAPERYFRVLAEVMRVAACPVDLVRFEDASETLLHRVSTAGRDL